MNSTTNPNSVARSIPRVLVVDDEPDLRELLELTLVRMGLDVDSAATVSEARAALSNTTYALCLTDMRLPDGSGMELVEAIGREFPATPVAVLTAFGSTDNAVAALKAGAFDYLSKPVALDHLRQLVTSAVKSNERSLPRASVTQAAQENATTLNRLLGESVAMREVRALIMRVARSQAPVAITGESGSGKELAARAIHDCSGRRSGPFVAVNCGAIPEQLMEAEFFGYRKGAFTGAQADREGYFQTAAGGTLFLDEVADLPLAMQVKLLRAIQERSVRRIGDMTEETVDVRLVSATHQNLSQCVAQGRFREDLFYRLNVIDIRVPPLRERRGDIGQLARHILKQVGADLALSPDALKKLEGHTFPGNVRELGNILERSAAFVEGDEIGAEDLQFVTAVEVPKSEQGAAPSVSTSEESAPLAGSSQASGKLLELASNLPEYLDRIERDMIEKALAQTRYNRTAAAELLGITFRQLRYRMQRLDIS
jgi:two-component system response regulator PilR (NtrC family)